MTFARIRLAVAALAFVGWLSWLAVAVWQKDAPDKVSRAQLTAADTLVVAQVTAAEDGTPQPEVTVVRRLTDAGPPDGTKISVLNLPSAVVAGKGFQASGEYLLPLTGSDIGVYQIAGWPRSPGYEEVRVGRGGGDPNQPLPRIYPWSEEVKAQMAKLKYKW